MTYNRLGEYLRANGLITEAELNEALHIQDANMVMIGALAKQSRLLSGLQVHQVIERQKRTHEPFGAAAEALGFCSAAAVDTLAGQQQDAVPLLGHILVILGYLSDETLEGALRDFGG